ncbi:hypothetical protein PHISP_05370 [Aspergillus sp. HF37]|nr:hypothetical protein PHISP_05370 [Aspergillus sp. HF37]
MPQAISAQNAASLDKDLMEMGGWSLDQLMELAGLSVSQAGKTTRNYIALQSSGNELTNTPVYRVHPPSSGTKILVVCGPGNNGGDGLVAARHLAQYGYTPTVYYPKEGKNELYQRLKTQLHNLSVPFTTSFTDSLNTSDLVVDAIFGFSFGGPLRDPFPSIVSQIEATPVPVLSVDAPSSWDIESGPPKEGPGAKFMPQTLVSLTAPKPCVKHYRGRHFMGGRFLTKAILEKYDLDCPDYHGIDQVVEVGVQGGRL